ncbi:Protein of unknown function [bacterium A37T11]|nr:Protein of unknown function [bacterium A37T11]
MKKYMLLLVLSTGIALSTKAQHENEDKSKRPSPPATVTETTSNGTKITIDYSQPSLKGRQLGSPDFVPFGKVWRTGANEATTFEVSKNVTVEGKALPAGKYGLFTIPGESQTTIIFNKVSQQWGAYKYDEKQDALRVTVPNAKGDIPVEKFTIQIAKDGKVSLIWAEWIVAFNVK